MARAELSSLPRVVAVGGAVLMNNGHDEDDEDDIKATAAVESLDLSTMRWSAAGYSMPSLPRPHPAATTAPPLRTPPPT